ncbi:MAG: hypothetical protein A2939_01010 [Parcubacteria group bacterium RIFCSPLOWO2_01_FULL_48_18]|nr:MAG: hypothetical protein A3J67_04895 [Parcubacteria group bacterium RIFCSPHIGHO2_02_FULL_48_10b]OHB22051.1 MAG: hypothetical protein A2939_01010 [Parcubacteria group bacterium RIFCSPLOWO2_01_FULL_48_18]
MAYEIRITVYGRVQGVFYRSWIKERADALGLTGYVRNDPDGSVTILAQGPEDAIEKFLRAAERGSRFSRVERIVHETIPIEKSTYADFRTL